MIEVAPEALDEIDDAVAWYDERRSGLGDELLAEIQHLLTQVGERPLSFQRLGDVPPELGVRRAMLDRFPFGLVFLRLPNGVQRVVAFAHAKRQPGYWLRRVAK